MATATLLLRFFSFFVIVLRATDYVLSGSPIAAQCGMSLEPGSLDPHLEMATRKRSVDESGSA